MSELTIKEVASMGGKARWEGKDKDQRREEMEKIQKLRKSVQDKEK